MANGYSVWVAAFHPGPQIRPQGWRGGGGNEGLSTSCVAPGLPAPAGSGGPPARPDGLTETEGPCEGSRLFLPSHPAPPDPRLSQLRPGTSASHPSLQTWLRGLASLL